MLRRARRPLPLATAVLTVTIVAVFVVEWVGDGPSLCARYGLVPAHPAACSVLTSCFLHDPSSWLHIGGNVVALALAGATIERLLGPMRVLALFLAAGVGGTMFHVAVDPTSNTPMVGASGCVCGLLAAVALVRPSSLAFVGTFIAYNIACLLLGTSGSVATGAHVGGFTAGALMMGTVFRHRLADQRSWLRAPRVARAVAARPW